MFFGSSDQCVLRRVCAKDLECQEVKISIPLGASLQEFDLIAGSFKWPGVNGIVVPVQEALAMSSEILGELNKYADPRGFRFTTPQLQVLCCHRLVAKFP